MKIYGLIGENINYSISPQIHNYVFKTCGIDAAYGNFDVSKDGFLKIKDAMKSLSIAGVNVTIPYKREFFGLCDGLSDIACQIGSVNTVVNKEGRLYGYNTDYYGFGKLYETAGFSATNKPSNCLILGNGGAGLAVSKFLYDQEIETVYVASRRIADSQYDNVKIRFYENISDLSGDILINTTPVGTDRDPNEIPVGEEIIKKFGCVLNVVYSPSPTKLTVTAKKLGIPAYDGLPMLVYQALKSEEIFNGIKVTEKLYREVLEYASTIINS